PVSQSSRPEMTGSAAEPICREIKAVITITKPSRGVVALLIVLIALLDPRSRGLGTSSARTRYRASVLAAPVYAARGVRQNGSLRRHGQGRPREWCPVDLGRFAPNPAGPAPNP